MDDEWAKRRLEQMLELVVAYGSPKDDRHREALQDAIRRAWPTVQKILEDLRPSAVGGGWGIGSRGWWLHAAAACREGLGVLADKEEVARHLSDAAPRASLDDLHPWVWNAAKTFWQTDGYRVAVGQAAAGLTGHVQAKVDRWDIADDELMNEVFSDKAPAEGKPRLRLPGSDTDQTQQSRQRGARGLAQGCYWALRNPATHQVVTWGEHQAVEALCAFSILARLIEECDVLRA